MRRAKRKKSPQIFDSVPSTRPILRTNQLNADIYIIHMRTYGICVLIAPLVALNAFSFVSLRTHTPYL